MLTLPSAVRVFVCTQPTDMRRGFDGLAALTSGVLRQDPLSGHLFVFRNRSGDRLKILYWDRDGYCLWYKRLEAGTFEVPDRPEITSAELSMLLDGVKLSQARRRRRFALPQVPVLAASP